MVEKLSASGESEEFSMEEMKEGIAFAHERQVKVYVTANILAHNTDLNGVREYFQELKEIGPDALIIADPGVFDIAKEVCPEIPRHISTQANNTNYGTYLFWYRQGAERVVTEGSFPWQRFGRSEDRFRRIWRSRLLSMERCVFLIRADVF